MPAHESAESTLGLFLGAFGLIVVGVWLGRYLPDIWGAGPAYQRIRRHLDGAYGGIWGAAFAGCLPIDSAMLIAAGALTLLLAVRRIGPTQLQAALDTGVGILIPTFLVLLVLFFSVILIAQPKVLIPPHLRTHGGVVPEFLGWAARRISSAARDIRRR
jgi:hypothetical protein